MTAQLDRLLASAMKGAFPARGTTRDASSLARRQAALVQKGSLIHRLLVRGLFISSCGLFTACTDGGADGGGAGGTGSGGDVVAPTVVANHPLDAVTGETTHPVISATFSEAMAPKSIDGVTFTLSADSGPVASKVSYAGTVATLDPSSALALSTKYTATVTTAATDVAGNALKAKYTWTFTTSATAPLGPEPVVLGTSGRYVILAESAVINVPTSKVTGDVALSPAAASYITGFALTKVGAYWTAPEVVGKIFAADSDPPTPSELTSAVGAMHAAYTDAAGRSNPTSLDLAGGAIGGATLAPGLYRWNSSVGIADDVTIAGGPNDVWIFQVTGDLDATAAKATVLTGGARAKNVVWQVAGEVNLGAGAHLDGSVLCKTAIGLDTGASVDGRLHGQTAVKVAGARVTEPVD